MKKRVLAILLVTVFVLCVFSACTSSNGGSTTATATAAGADTSAATAGNAAPSESYMGDSKTFNLQMQCHQSGEQANTSVKPTVDLMIKDTQGTVNVKLFGAGQLMPAGEMFNAVKNGDLDMAMWAEGMFSSVIPVTEIGSGLPLAYANSSEAYMFMWHRGFLEILRAEYAKHNIYYIPWQVYESSIMTKKPVLKLDDLKGMKLRAGGSMALLLNEIGSSVVSIAGSELYSALSTGVIDGATWGDAAPMFEMKFQEVTKNYLQPELIGGFWTGIYINMDVWNKFSPEQKFAMESAITHGGREHIEQVKASYTRALNIMQRDFGVTVNRLPSEELEKVQVSAEKVWQIIADKDATNAKVIQMVKEFRAEKDDVTKVTPPYSAEGLRR